jgi:Tfp pilus assembly protein PilV
MCLNNKGITLIESMVAVFLTAIAVISLMPMLDMALRTGSRSDLLGRAEGILQTELELQEQTIMKTISSASVPLGTATKNVSVSGITGVAGDANFTVVTTTSLNQALTNSWIVNVTVTWTGNATGITSSIVASQQAGFQ